MRRPHVIDALNRVRGPFNVNRPAIAAGIASLGDTAHVEKAVAHNARVVALDDRQRSRRWGIEVDAERRQFRAARAFPKTPGVDGAATPTPI